MNDYYVYCIFDTDGVPRYIGAGRGSGSRDRLRHWRQLSTLYPNAGSTRPVIQWLARLGGPPEIRCCLSGLSHTQASAWEKGLIASIGRQVTGTGPLLNIAAGGARRSRQQRQHEAAIDHWEEIAARI